VIAETTRSLDRFKYSESVAGLYRFFWNDFCDWYLEWAKHRLRQARPDRVAQNVLAFVLDQVLRLLHPFMPFITEGLFQKLNEAAPERGLKGLAEAPPAEALVTAAWPEKPARLADDGEAETISLIQAAVRTVRDLRSLHNCPASRRMTASATGKKPVTELLNRHADLVCQLAGLERFSAASDLEKPPGAAAVVGEQVQVYLHDAEDIQAQRKRFEKQARQLEQKRNRLAAKLENRDFLSKAKPGIVQKTRSQLAEVTKQLEETAAHLGEQGI
jgi:valyl-tRNA synthetase